MSPEALNVFKTIMIAGSVLSLIVALLPILWGEVRIKWLVTGLVSCVTYGLFGIMIPGAPQEQGLYEPLPPIQAAPPPAPVRAAEPQPPVEIPWAGLGRMVAVALALYVAWRTAKAALRILRERRRARTEEAEARRAAVDPVRVAMAHAPETVDDVRTAMDRVSRLERVGANPSDPLDADALTMARKRLPAVMERLATAMEAADGNDEKAALARTALRSVIDIGTMAEEARRRIAGGLRDGLDTEARYIARASGSAAGGLTAQ